MMDTNWITLAIKPFIACAILYLGTESKANTSIYNPLGKGEFSLKSYILKEFFLYIFKNTVFASVSLLG